MSCELTHAKKLNPQVVQQHLEKESISAVDEYKADDFVSMDQFVVSTPRWQLTENEVEVENNQFHSGTIFNDITSGAIWVEHQVSLHADETIMAKICFEEWLWH